MVSSIKLNRMNNTEKILWCGEQILYQPKFIWRLDREILGIFFSFDKYPSFRQKIFYIIINKLK